MTLLELAIITGALALAALGLFSLQAIRRSRGVPSRSLDKRNSDRALCEEAEPRRGARKPPASVATRMRWVDANRVIDGERGIGPFGTEPDYFKSVEGKLEQAFELYVRERISIQTYLEMVERLRSEAVVKVARLEATAPTRLAGLDKADPHLQAIWALEAIEWCCNWARVQISDRSSDAAASTDRRAPEFLRP